MKQIETSSENTTFINNLNLYEDGKAKKDKIEVLEWNPIKELFELIKDIDDNTPKENLPDIDSKTIKQVLRRPKNLISNWLGWSTLHTIFDENKELSGLIVDLEWTDKRSLLISNNGEWTYQRYESENNWTKWNNPLEKISELMKNIDDNTLQNDLPTVHKDTIKMISKQFNLSWNNANVLSDWTNIDGVETTRFMDSNNNINRVKIVFPNTSRKLFIDIKSKTSNRATKDLKPNVAYNNPNQSPEKKQKRCKAIVKSLQEDFNEKKFNYLKVDYDKANNQFVITNIDDNPATITIETTTTIKAWESMSFDVTENLETNTVIFSPTGWSANFSIGSIELPLKKISKQEK